MKNFYQHTYDRKYNFYTLLYYITVSHDTPIFLVKYRGAYFCYFFEIYSTFIDVHCSSRSENYRLTDSFFVIIPNRCDFALAQYTEG